MRRLEILPDRHHPQRFSRVLAAVGGYTLSREYFHAAHSTDDYSMLWTTAQYHSRTTARVMEIVHSQGVAEELDVDNLLQVSSIFGGIQEDQKMKSTRFAFGCLLIVLLALPGGRRPEAALATVHPTIVSAIDSPTKSSSGTVEFALEMIGDPDRFSGPLDVAVDHQGHLYVLDCKHNRIQKFDPSGQLLTMWGRSGRGDGEFRIAFRDQLCSRCPFAIQCLGAIAVDRQGNVYVADTANARIQKFDRHGSLLAVRSDRGYGDGQFVVPISVAVDRQDNVYVLDRDRDDVQKFDSDGRFLSKWVVYNKALYGQLAVDTQGHTYVTTWDPEERYSRVQKFDGKGNRISEWGRAQGEERLLGPWGVAVDDQGNVYVADEIGARIQAFDSQGNLLAKWGTLGISTGEFRAPCGLAVSATGDIYVADFGNNRIQKFRQH